jgi:phage RecT family recombinase
MSNGMEIQLLDVRQHKAVLTQQQERLDRWCANGDVRGEALIRYALAEMESNADLRNCTPTSVYLALLACAVTGLPPGKLRGLSFLVPFTNTKKDGNNEYKVSEATFMMGWRGVKHIGYRAGLDLVSAVIHDRDDFDFDKGTASFVRYKPALRGVGPVIGSAAWCKLPRGGLEVEYLNAEELEKVKQAATRFRKSPAWDGPFRDQMERKTALKRLGKQIEVGEEFFKANMLEDAQEGERGSQVAVLDELTDGSATKLLGQQSAEAAAFGALPRPTQVQVPAEKPNDGKLATAADKARTADAKRAARPTTPAASGGSAPPSNAPAQSSDAKPSSSNSSASSSAGVAASPTNPTPATSSAGSASLPASAATPAASSSPASTTAPARAASSSAAAATSVSAPADQSPPPSESSETFGDVAGEPAPDEAFDVSFGDASDDPVDRQPETREDWLNAFRAWAAAHPNREDVLADDSWIPIFRGWLSVCTSKAGMDQDKPVFTDWSKAAHLTSGRKADPARNISAIPPDRQIAQMQDEFARRYREVP